MYLSDKSSNEIDLIMEGDGVLHPMEIKRTANPGSQLVRPFTLLDKGSTPRGKGAVLCLRTELSALDAEDFIEPIWII